MPSAPIPQTAWAFSLSRERIYDSTPQWCLIEWTQHNVYYKASHLPASGSKLANKHSEWKEEWCWMQSGTFTKSSFDTMMELELDKIAFRKIKLGKCPEGAMSDVRIHTPYTLWCESVWNRRSVVRESGSVYTETAAESQVFRLSKMKSFY